jgi:hypothetical protein
MAAGGGAVTKRLSLFTSPLGGEVGAQRRVRGPFVTLPSEGPLTRPKRVDLSPEGRGEK